MHELSIAQEIIRIIRTQQAQHAFTHVNSVKFRAGALSGIQPSALRFAFETISPGTCAADAQLEIDSEPMTASCRQCNHSIDARCGPTSCPKCKSTDLHLQGSTSFEIISLDVD